MQQTLFDKIWDFHRVAQRADGRDLIYIDRHVLHELHAHHAFARLHKQGRPVRRADLTFAVQDHTVATRPGRDDDTNPPGSAFIKAMREGCRANGIRLFDIDDPEQGISHVVAPELGIVLPGATHAVPDSHASTVGGVGALAFGCGTSELAHILATQVMALKRPKNMRVQLDGRLAAGVSAKDVALRIIAEIGVAGARGHVVEYAGAVVGAMPIEQRMTLCNLNIEMGGRSGLVAPDDVTFAWLARRPFVPQGMEWDRALRHWRRLASDEGAGFDRDVRLDCTILEPQITWGTDPSQVIGISGRVPDPAALDPGRRGAAASAFGYMDLAPGTPLLGLPINRVFIGSCTNSRLPTCRLRPMSCAGGMLPKASSLWWCQVRRASNAMLRPPDSIACFARPDFSGANPDARCAPVAMAIVANPASAASRPPTAILKTARGQKCERILPVRRLRPRAPSQVALPMRGNLRQGRHDAAVHLPHRHCRAIGQGRH